MKAEDLRGFFIKADSCKIGFEGRCHDCGQEVCIEADLDPKTWKLEIRGGALYQIEYNGAKAIYLKCDECFKQDPVLRNFRRCEVYSRVVGYLRPVSDWNEGKRAEYNMRKEFKMGKEML